MRADDVRGSVTGPAAIRPHVDVVLAQSNARADWRVTPTAYADGYTYEVNITAFVSRAQLEDEYPKRYVIGAGQQVDDDGSTIVRGLN